MYYWHKNEKSTLPRSYSNRNYALYPHTNTFMFKLKSDKLAVPLLGKILLLVTELYSVNTRTHLRASPTPFMSKENDLFYDNDVHSSEVNVMDVLLHSNYIDMGKRQKRKKNKFQLCAIDIYISLWHLARLAPNETI